MVRNERCLYIFSMCSMGVPSMCGLDVPNKCDMKICPIQHPELRKADYETTKRQSDLWILQCERERRRQ